MIKAHMAEQDGVLQQHRQEYHSAKGEINNLKRTLKELQDAKDLEQQKTQEVQQKSTELDRSLQAATKRNQELQERCDELSKQCELERKQK